MNIFDQALGGKGAIRLAQALKQIISEQAHQTDSNMVELGRDKMSVKVSVLKSFLVHHLETELQQSAFSSGDKIRYRQVLEHSELIKVEESSRHVFILSLLKKVWMEDLFEQYLNDGEQDYIYNRKQLKELKAQIANKYLFELYQLKQFIEAGLKNFEPKSYVGAFPLSSLLMLSDQVVHSVISRKSKEVLRRAMTKNYSEVESDRIKEMKGRWDLLKGFNAATYQYSDFLNKDKIYKDLAFVLDKAAALFSDFQADMKTIFGSSILCDLKVRKNPSGDYNVVGIRRLLVKWAENLLENDPDLVYTQPFHEFIKNKNKVFDNFYVRSGVQSQSTHQKIIAILLQLLASSSFIEGRKPNPNFGLYIYDLLRSKVAVCSLDQLQKVLARLQRPKKCKQYISLLRVKNRLLTHNRDVMVNFRYGELLVAECQISVDQEQEYHSDKHQKHYQFKHYLYELERSIFGPTMELIVIYQDFYRKDITARMVSTGKLSRWCGRQKLKGIEMTSVQCPSHHRLLLVSDNVFSTRKQLYCRFCYKSFTLPLHYLYCYHCSITYCDECYELFKNQNDEIRKNFRKPIVKGKMSSLNGLRGLQLVFFHLSYSPASALALKFLQFVNKTYYLKKPRLNILQINVEDELGNFEQLAKLGLYRFPAFILFKQSQPVKKLHGLSVYKLFQLIHIVAEGVLTKKCPDGHQLKPRNPPEYAFWRCAECYACKDDLNPEEVYFCKDCMYVCCSKCSFTKNNIQEYVDTHGVSYLSTSICRPLTTLLCAKQHLFEYTHKNPLPTPLNTCCKCSSQFYFLTESGMSICRACGDLVCSKCSGVLPNIIDRTQYANHFVEMTAHEVFPCRQCKNNFKKTYTCNSRSWMCSNCQKQYANKTLHLMCYKCDLRYCWECSRGMLKTTESDFTSIWMVKYDLSRCKCTSCGKGLVKRQGSGIKDLCKLVMCEICSEAHYMNTVHYHCPNCEMNFCQGCLEEQIDRQRRRFTVFIVATGKDDTSQVQQVQVNLQADQTLQDLQAHLRKLKMIPLQSSGKFRMRQGVGDFQPTTVVGGLPPHTNLYYYIVAATDQIHKLMQLHGLDKEQHDNEFTENRMNATDLYLRGFADNETQAEHVIKKDKKCWEKCCKCLLM